MYRNHDTGVRAPGTPKKSVSRRSSIPRCPNCNSATVRKREMIVKTGTYDKFGASTGFSSRSSTRVFLSRGRNNWVEELMPMSYLWPSLLALYLWGTLGSADGTFSFGYFLAVLFNLLWFLMVHSSRGSFRREWACSKCGEVWDPTEPEESSA